MGRTCSYYLSVNWVGFRGSRPTAAVSPARESNFFVRTPISGSTTFGDGSRLRLTTSVDHDVLPVWSPDGREVAFRSGTHHEPTIGFAAADGTGVTRTLACPQLPCEPSDWSPDGTYLVVTVARP